jgi:AraC-like DNA-binding protein
MDFNLRHMERYGEPANYYSAELADAIDLIAEGLRRTGEADAEKLRDAVESIRDFDGMQGTYDLSPMDHYGTGIEQMVLLTARDGAWHVEKAFSPNDRFEDVHRNRKANLVRMLADLLTPPSTERVFPSIGKESSGDFIASRSETRCTDPGRGPHLLAKLVCQRKRELSRSMREGDFRRAGEVLFHMLTFILTQDLERRDKIKLAVLELFLLLFHSAMEEGNLEDLAGLDQRFTAEWEALDDPESLCLWIVRVFDQLKRTAHSDGGPRSDLLKRVLDFIESHFSEDLPVERIAREVCLSPSRLIHRMRSEYNSNLGRCIVEVRMKKAKTLLMETDISISAIAQDVGYRDQSHFTRIFHRHVGFTPKDYRNASVSPGSA